MFFSFTGLCPELPSQETEGTDLTGIIKEMDLGLVDEFNKLMSGGSNGLDIFLKLISGADNANPKKTN